MSEKMEIKTKHKLLIGAGVLLYLITFAGPLITLAVINAKNLIILGMCVGGIFAGFLSVPLITMKWKNLILKLIKQEAMRNPIETLENELIQCKKSQNKAIETFKSISGMHYSLKEKLEIFKRKYDTTDEGMEEMLKKSAQVIQIFKIAIKRLDKEIKEFSKCVDTEKARFKLAKETGELAKALKEATGDSDPMQKYIRNEALDSVRDKFHRSMSEINMILSENEIVTQLSSDDSINGQISFTPLEIPEIDSLKMEKEMA